MWTLFVHLSKHSSGPFGSTSTNFDNRLITTEFGPNPSIDGTIAANGKTSNKHLSGSWSKFFPKKDRCFDLASPFAATSKGGVGHGAAGSCSRGLLHSQLRSWLLDQFVADNEVVSHAEVESHARRCQSTQTVSLTITRILYIIKHHPIWNTFDIFVIYIQYPSHYA